MSGSHVLCFLLLAAISIPAQNPTASSTPPAQPRTATDYFRRADDLTNLRLPGAAPFHMKVTFAALPIVDLATHARLADPQSPPVAGHPFVITGNGTYEETWISPEKWRREVIFAGYHAVEIRAGGARKFQASSDYEPDRVMMLLSALLTPVPRYLLEPEIYEHRPHWKVERLEAGNLPYIRISSKSSLGQEEIESATTAYIFLPSGLLLRTDNGKVVTTWQRPSSFNGHMVPQRIVVNAMGKDVLTADVAIEPANAPDPAMFALSGPAAEPGATLRPLSSFDLTVQPNPEHQEMPSFPHTGFNPPIGSGVTLRAVIDRTGAVQEVELIDAVPYTPGDHEAVPHYLMDIMKATVTALQHSRWHPATIDNSPRQFVVTVPLVFTPTGPSLQ